MKRDPTIRDCRRALCSLYNRALKDTISASKAARLAYIVQIVLKSLEADELRWQQRESASPSAQEIAQQIREAMHAADELIPPPPPTKEGEGQGDE